VKGKGNVWKGMLIGATVGAAFSLFIKKEGQQSRLSLPMKLKQWRQSVEGMAEDAEFIMEKIKDIAEKTPEVIEIVKEAYSWKKDDRPRIK
jgi:gas vesicle protein